MNNEQFRRLIGANKPKSTASSNGSSPTPSRAAALGSRHHSSIPMTPRSVGLSRSDFQRQLWEHGQGKKQEKRFKSSTPKGAKLADGYTDRAKARVDDEGDERAERIKALEESLKKEEIDQGTFERLRSQIAGGDLSSTHLIHGLDYKLLERVRKGENVFDEPQESEDHPSTKNVDDAFDQLEKNTIEAVAHDKTEKHGHLAETTLKPGQKRTRDMILAEMKAARAAAKAKAEENALGSHFRKIGDRAPGMRIERDSRGREVLIIVDEDGHEKRKVRRVQDEAEKRREQEEEAEARASMMPAPGAQPLGMDVPEFYQRMSGEQEDKEVNIFDDAGSDYDPLAGLEEADSDEESASEKSKPEEEDSTSKDTRPPPPKPKMDPRDYFKDSKSTMLSDETFTTPSISDPAIQAALRKAATIRAPADEDDEEAKAKAERRRKMLQNVDRDAEDMDLGFGTSRFEDEADFDDVKLSRWKGAEGDDGNGEGGRGGNKHKRGKKKRKGDVNNAADVLRVMEQQKQRAS